VLLALPATETELIRHWTLGAADLAAIERRRGDPNQLGFEHHAGWALRGCDRE
jgi:hypothetical protein